MGFSYLILIQPFIAKWSKSFFVIVPDLPESIPIGTRALPTPTDDGILHIYNSKIHRMDCTSESCSWTTSPQQFTSSTLWFSAMYIPEKFTDCSPPLASGMECLIYP